MSKSDIFNAIRKRRAYFQTPHIEIKSPKTLTLEERKKMFCDNLKAGGGEIVELKTGEAEKYLAEHFPRVLDFTKKEVFEKYVSTDRKELDNVECVLFRAMLGVAENAAVWIEDSDMPQRLLPFITQHLILKVDETQLVGDMVDAYEKIHLADTGFGVFISGPSKTADIEQSLVYGAHGAMRCTVLLCQE